LGEDGEEVFVEGFGDLEEEVGVEAFALLLLVSTIKGSRIAYLNQRTSNTEAHVDMNIPPNALYELTCKVSNMNIHTTKTSILLSLMVRL
jgi:hypothetical protein